VEARSAQQQHEAWMEDHHELGRGYSEVARELALRSRQRVAFAELEQPGYLTGALGPVPESVRGRRAWRQAMLCVHDTQIPWGEVCVCVCVCVSTTSPCSHPPSCWPCCGLSPPTWTTSACCCWPSTPATSCTPPEPSILLLTKGSTGNFHFNLLATNGQVIASSESYESKASVLNGIESIKRNAPSAAIDDQTNK
jgi:uncharacterized protein YegP (UPF0339 family)